MIGFVVFAHGSRVESANEAVKIVTAQMGEAVEGPVEAAFLELGVPNLSDAVARLAARGVTRVVVIPYFLTLGTHLQRDLPRLADQAARKHPHVSVEVTAPLDGHPALLQALLDRAATAAVGGAA
jgi:sirohydrochlorin ferrochelatase